MGQSQQRHYRELPRVTRLSRVVSAASQIGTIGPQRPNPTVSEWAVKTPKSDFVAAYGIDARLRSEAPRRAQMRGRQHDHRSRGWRPVFLEIFRKEGRRSEEHTSELQSLRHLVCRLLLEKKK